MNDPGELTQTVSNDCLKADTKEMLDSFTLWFNPSSVNPTKWSNTLKQLACNANKLFESF